jgi:predicted nucleic acid-binding protein
LKVTGLLGILLRAKQVGQIESLQPIIDDLINKAGFWIATKLLAQILMQ